MHVLSGHEGITGYLWASVRLAPALGTAPPFSAHVCCDQTAGWIKMPLGTEVGLEPRQIVLDGDPAPSKKGAQHPYFSAHVYCGRKAGLIKMQLDTEVGLGPGHTVLDGDSAPPLKIGDPAAPRFFDPCLSWPNDRPSQLLLSTCTNCRPKTVTDYQRNRPLYNFPLQNRTTVAAPGPFRSIS